MMTYLEAFWEWCCFVKDLVTNFLVGRGVRWSSGAFSFGIMSSIYTLLAWLVTALFGALDELLTVVPDMVETVSSEMVSASSGVSSSFLEMVNYILPIDFMATCLCIYFSVWVGCWTVGIVFKFLDFLSDVNPIG